MTCELAYDLVWMMVYELVWMMVYEMVQMLVYELVYEMVYEMAYKLVYEMVWMMVQLLLLNYQSSKLDLRNYKISSIPPGEMNEYVIWEQLVPSYWSFSANSSPVDGSYSLRYVSL